MRPITGGLSATCGEPLFSPYAVAGAPGETRYGLCRRVEPAFARAVAYGSYESGLRELIHLLKFAGVHPAARTLNISAQHVEIGSHAGDRQMEERIGADDVPMAEAVGI